MKLIAENKKLILENTHKLLDPEWAHEVIRIKCARPIAALRDAVAYSANLLLRATGESEGVLADDVVVLCLFRQVVAAADAASELLSAGAGYMARLPARSLFEGTLCLLWVLNRDTELRTRQYVVSSFRRMRIWQLRGFGDNPHNETFERLWREGFERESTPERVEQAGTDADNIEVMLNRPDLRDVNRAFDEEARRLSREPEWYVPGGVAGYGGMARELGGRCPLLYEILYDSLSDAVHGREISKHAFNGRIEMVRDPHDVPTVFHHTLNCLVEAIEAITNKFRPSEWGDLKRKISAWKSAGIEMPKWVTGT